MPRQRSEYRPAVMPRNAELIRHFARLGLEIKRFLDTPAQKLLIIVGPRGTGKSRAIEAVLARLRLDAFFLNCPGKPWRFYMEMFHRADHARYPGRIIVLNEARPLFRNDRSVDLVKTMTEQRQVNKVQWGYSTPAEMRSGEIPDEFLTSARFIVICNSWPEDNPDMDAIRSRGTMLYFNPSAPEMHRHAGRWYQGRRDVFDFMGRHLAECEEPDLRYYEVANEKAEWAAKVGLPDSYWKDWVLSLAFVGPKKIAWQLMNDPSFRNDNERAKEFARLSGKSERTFYRLRDELKGRMDDSEEETSAGSCQNVELLL
jgi:hypothetical protein